MRVLFVCNGLAGGGAEKLLNDLLPVLRDKNGVVCELLILSKKNEKYLDSLLLQNIKVSILPSSCNNHFKRINYIIRFIKNNHFNIVHANLFPSFYYCSLAKKVLGKEFPRLVMTEHSTDNRRRHIKLLRPLEKWIYKSFDAVVSISKDTQSALIDWLECSSSNKFLTIYNGIPVRRYSFVKPCLREDLYEKIEDGDILIGMVASFRKIKNHKFMIKVLSYLPSHYKLIFIGEGELQNEIANLVGALGLEERVRFLGFKKNVAECLRAFDICVIPSIWEGFGLVAVEAMACGIPVVCSDVPGLADVVGNAGIISPINDPKQFSKAIMHLENKELYNACIKKGKIRAMRYDIETMSANYYILYHKLLQN